MDVDDVAAALTEAERVLRPSGTLVISIVHPLTDCWCFVGAGPDAQFVLKKSYFGRRRFEGTEARDGLRTHLAGWSQPLGSYVPHWATRDWQSRHCGNPSQTLASEETIWGGGAGIHFSLAESAA